MKKLPDLTTPGQKIVAGGLLALVLVIFYFLLPPLVMIFANLWLVVLLGVPLVLLILNYEVIWTMFKQISWNMTKKLISTDPMWHMYRYYDYLIGKINGLEGAIIEVDTVKEKSSRKIVEHKDELNKFMSQVERESVKNSDSVLVKVLKSKISTNQRNIDMLLPRLEFVEKQSAQLRQVHTMWSADTEILKHELDIKAQEYEMLKELSGATDKASSYLGDNTVEMKMFKESLKQIEDSVSTYTANIANFDSKVLPQLAKSGTDFEYNVEEGDKIIEKLKQERLNIKN